jgi:hypothetical protein
MPAYDTSGNFTPPGTFYSWGAGSGFAVLNIDLNKIQANFPTGSQNNALTHAIRAGMGWLTGLGTWATAATGPGRNRGDQSEGLLSNSGTSYAPGVRTADQCRAQHYMEKEDFRVYTYSQGYCGAD